jgi:pimeloyl-ACP methyl ester carboxylesterase
VGVPQAKPPPLSAKTHSPRRDICLLGVMMSRLLPVMLLIGLMLSALTAKAASVSCKPARVDVGGYKLWMQVAGVGELTVVFESGGGDDSSVWAKIEPEIRRDGVRTVVYDRAGLGQSDLKSGPYSIDHEARGLERALDKCGVRGPIVLVAHSYGGFVSALVAAEDLRVVGLVFVEPVTAAIMSCAIARNSSSTPSSAWLNA